MKKLKRAGKKIKTFALGLIKRDKKPLIIPRVSTVVVCPICGSSNIDTWDEPSDYCLDCKHIFRANNAC